MTKCAFFVHERIIMRLEVISGPARSSEPIIQEFKRCSHPHALHTARTIGENIKCEGCLADCTISFESQELSCLSAFSHTL